MISVENCSTFTVNVAIKACASRSTSTVHKTSRGVSNTLTGTGGASATTANISASRATRNESASENAETLEYIQLSAGQELSTGNTFSTFLPSWLLIDVLLLSTVSQIQHDTIP
jgi:hypothetical protein